jgi:hypothetical protein
MSNGESKRAERRISPRAKMARMLRVRPSDPDVEHFEELPVSTNVSKKGIFFQSSRKDYHVGMRLFVTYPFTFANDPMKSEYLGEVVRIEKLANDRVGIAVRLIMTV